MARSLDTGFRVVLGAFVGAPLGFVLTSAFAPPDVFTQIAVGLPLVGVCGVVGAYVAVLYALDTHRLSWALVTLYVASFVALVVVQTVALATVGWLRGPGVELFSFAVGAVCAYWVGFRRH